MSLEVLKRLLEYAAYCAIYGYAALGWLNILRMWHVRLRLFGLPSIRSCRQALDFDQKRIDKRQTRREHAARIAARMAATALALALIATYWHLAFVMHLAVFFALVAGWHIAAKALPPSVLLLGASGSEADLLYALVISSSTPLHVACMMSIGSDPEPVRLERGDVPAASSVPPLVPVPATHYRTRTDAEWRPVVRSLMEAASVIVVDARIVTPQIVYEMNELLDTRFLDKVVFVSTDDRQLPLVAEFRRSRNDLPEIPPERALTFAEIPIWFSISFSGVGYWRPGLLKYIDRAVGL